MSPQQRIEAKVPASSYSPAYSLPRDQKHFWGTGESVAPHWGLFSEGSVKGTVANTCSRIANTVMNMLFATNNLYPGLDSTSQSFSTRW